MQHVKATDLAKSTVLIIGAGGAAKAVIGALLSLGVPEIRVTNRNDAKAADLVAMADLPSLYAVPWAERHESLRSADIVVNSSAGGMAGKPPLDFDLTNAPDTAFIYDLIYTPRMTPLLKAAKRQKLAYLGGLDMLIAQAKPSFRLFYGTNPKAGSDPTEVLLSALKSGQR
ncbi:shikimate dehydrogenase [Litorimonas sp. RW-G-Af-16]|uniref:shikimate dehydrogenase family protein n=1 Tax=Litorimonas sp. RW-G-Af-16 TaxID=3241168 RepID=UPI003AAD7126